MNAATNQIVGQNYDSNGNQTSSSTGTLTCDAENRVLMAASAAVQYGYDSRNKRVWSATISNGNMTQFVYFYGVDGQKLGNYQFANAGTTAPVLTDDHPTLMVYFGSKRAATISSTGVTSAFAPDRLGSSGGYYPYGEARGTVPQDDVGYATYTNDSATGLQYADQRYYASNFGRFMSPDPYKAKLGSASDPSEPSSWNHYAYVGGEPINYVDPRGLQKLISKVEDEPDPGEYMGTLVDCISGGDENDSYEFCSIEDEYSGSGGAGGGGARKPPPDCKSYTSDQVNFVKSFSGTANLLGSLDGVPGDWILAWAAYESGWGQGPAVVDGNNNYFSWSGAGDIRCPQGAFPGFGCYSSSDDPFFFSGNSALFGYSRYDQYNGQTGGTYGAVLQSQYDSGASLTQAFNAVGAAGYDTKDAKTGAYGAGVATRNAQILGKELCLNLGLLH